MEDKTKETGNNIKYPTYKEVNKEVKALIKTATFCELICIRAFLRGYLKE